MYLSINFQGNAHQAMQYVNTLKCRDRLFQIIYFRPDCILIFKVPSREDEVEARKELGLREMP